MSRGGNRAGKVGRVYANRTDLPGKTTGPNGQVVTPGKPLPVAVPTGGQYGSATAMANAQRSLPMAAPDVGGSATPSLPGAAGGGASPTPPPAFSMPPGVPGPGDLPALHAPTDRPDEHVMTGVDQPLPPTQPQGVNTMQTGAFLAHLAAQPGAPAEMVALAQMAQRRG
jgi:hypothetical protein